MHKKGNRFVLSIAVMLALLTGVLPAYAESSASPLFASGDFAWARSMGGGTLDSGHAIAVDSSGNVYTTGYFEGTVDFDPGPGTANLASTGTGFEAGDIFVSKFDSSGNFVWAKSMGGTDGESGFGIAVDSSGNVYTTGYFAGTVDFDPGPGTANLTGPFGDVFVSKLDNNGNFVWAKKMGGASFDVGNDIALDSGGNIYTTGFFQVPADFDPGAGTFILTPVGGTDVFVSKLDSAGNFVWAKGIGGTGNDIGNDLAVDSSGNVYATGEFSDTADFDPSGDTANLTSAGDSDIFVSKLDSVGSFVWAYSVGGVNIDSGYSITVDSNDNFYTTGYFEDAVDFDPGPGTTNLTSFGNSPGFLFGDIFVSKFDSSGHFVWAKGMGGTLEDWSRGIAVDSSGNVYTTGLFNGTTDFDPGPGTFNLTSTGFFGDIFVSKLDDNGNFVWAKSMGDGTDDDYGNSVAADSSGNVYITGSFEGTADFDPGPGTFNLTSTGGDDIFVSKLEGDSNEGLQVAIDVVPGSAANIINLRSTSVPVAILSSNGFNAVTDLNRSSLRFGKTGNESSFMSCAKSGQDVNLDGRLDLICSFRISLTGLVVGDTAAILKGSTVAGIPFEGSSFVKVMNRSK